MTPAIPHVPWGCIMRVCSPEAGGANLKPHNSAHTTCAPEVYGKGLALATGTGFVTPYSVTAGVAARPSPRQAESVGDNPDPHTSAHPNVRARDAKDRDVKASGLVFAVGTDFPDTGFRDGTEVPPRQRLACIPGACRTHQRR